MRIISAYYNRISSTDGGVGIISGGLQVIYKFKALSTFVVGNAFYVFQCDVRSIYHIIDEESGVSFSP